VLNAAGAGVLASVNARVVQAYPRARVALLSTGDELVTDGSPLKIGQIRESNLTISYTFPSQNITGSAFSFLIVGSDSIAASTTVTITTTAGTLTSPVTAVPTTAGLFNILLSSFTGTGDLNFATGITFSFVTASPGSDRAIDAFGIDLPQVPEASTYAAVGFMSIAAFGAYRRVRK
jgi:hypothetical protein